MPSEDPIQLRDRNNGALTVVERMRKLFQNHNDGPPRGTPEFFAYASRRNKENDRRAEEEAKKRNQIFRLSIRALGVSSYMRARQLAQQEREVQTKVKREQNSYRLSVRGLPAVLGTRRSSISSQGSFKKSVTTGNPKFLNRKYLRKHLEEEEDGAPLVIYNEAQVVSSSDEDESDVERSEGEVEQSDSEAVDASETEESDVEASSRANELVTSDSDVHHSESEAEVSESEANNSESEVEQSDSEANNSESEVEQSDSEANNSESEAETSDFEANNPDSETGSEPDTRTKFDNQEFAMKLESMHKYEPNSIIAQTLSMPMFNSYTIDEQEQLSYIWATGVRIPDADPGCYARDETDYDTFEDVFNSILSHKFDLTSAQLNRPFESDWEIDDGDNLAFKDPVDVTLSASRNVVGYPLPCAMSKNERLQFEADVLQALQVLRKSEPKVFKKAQVFSLSPTLEDGSENPHRCSEEDYQLMVHGPYMVPDLEDDPFLSEAGFAEDWPHGRGAIVAGQGAYSIVYGGEDHLRIVVREQECIELAQLLELLHQLVETIQDESGFQFMKHNQFGYITSNPYKAGSGVMCSALLEIPGVIGDGNLHRIDDEFKELGVQVSHPFEDLSNKVLAGDGLVQVNSLVGFRETEGAMAVLLFNAVEDLLRKEREHDKAEFNNVSLEGCE